MQSKKLFIVVILIIFCGYFFINNSIKASSYFTKTISYGEFKTEIEKNNTKSKISSIESLYVVGDLMLARDVERRLLTNGNNYPFKQLNFNNNESYVLANFESAIPTEHQPTPNNTFRFSTNEIFLSALKDAGFTHVSLANNHSFDFGLAGYNNAITKLWNNDIVPFGHPTVLSTSSVVFLDLSDITISVIALHTLLNQPDDIVLQQVLDYATDYSDLQMIYIHWGDEYNEIQSINQVKFAKKLSLLGADIIVGHHPHVVQGIEKINNTVVFYSLGNYIFDQYFSESVQTGLMLRISFDNLLRLELLPVTSLESKNQPRLQNSQEKQLFLDKLSERSSQDLSNQIKSGYINFNITLATSTEVAIMAE